MKSLIKSRVSALLFALGILIIPSISQAACVPRFLNPLTDVCWSCIFPITIFNLDFSPSGVEPSKDPNPPFCLCDNGPGIPISFYEPIASVDVVKQPYCFLNLGFSLPISALPFDPDGTVHRKPNAGNQHTTENSFYNIHYYTNPLLVWLGLVLDFLCLDTGDFDLAYLSEADPTWVDPNLALILSPDAILYGNIAAVAACSVDCVSSTALDGPINLLHWCAGCQGTVYPMTGKMEHHYSGMSTSVNLTQRILTKLHRLGIMKASTGPDGMCDFVPEIMIKKSNYKIQVTHPYPQDKILTGSCCQNMGFAATIYEAGKNLPVVGEDYGHLIFRKRDCCSGPTGFIP